jgi:hypothetical protein
VLQQLVNVYEDGVYHTFVFVEPDLSLGRVDPRITPLLSGTLKSPSGAPLADQLVSVKLSDGTTRKLSTNAKGGFVVINAPPGAITVESGNASTTAAISQGKTTVGTLSLKPN